LLFVTARCSLLEFAARRAYNSAMQRLVAILLLALTALAAPAANYKLNLFIWSEYIDPEIISEFEKRYDVKVTMDVYEDESAMLAKLQGGGAAFTTSLFRLTTPCPPSSS
jgi:spermidine/putrescine-binding protein